MIFIFGILNIEYAWCNHFLMFGSWAALFATKSLNPRKHKPLTENRLFWDGYNRILIWSFLSQTLDTRDNRYNKDVDKSERPLFATTIMCRGRSFTQQCARQTKTQSHTQTESVTDTAGTQLLSKTFDILYYFLIVFPFFKTHCTLVL